MHYENIYSNAESISNYLSIDENERPITLMPMHYSFGLSIINSHLIKGATILFTNKSLIEKYHIGASRYGVFTDHPRLKMHYRWVAEDIHPNVLDLSIFVINPEKWDEVPETDEETLKDKKILYMPRYMNHKDDILFKKDATAAVDAFNYGVLGEQAVAHNYVETIQKESINILEIYGYCFDKLQPYLKGVPKKSKDRVQHLIDQTTIKIKNTREKMHGNNIRNY